MKTKYLQVNPETGKPEAFVSLSDQDVIFLKEVLNLYDTSRLGDTDDVTYQHVKKDLMLELHEAWKQLRPS